MELLVSAHYKHITFRSNGQSRVLRAIFSFRRFVNDE